MTTVNEHILVLQTLAAVALGVTGITILHQIAWCGICAGAMVH